MSRPEQDALETDPRFPSGAWTGFFLEPNLPGKHWMELHLSFSQGAMTGGGRDWVGTFIVRGNYGIEDGKCHWNKRYIGKHDVFYQGFNEGKGIWGTWEIPGDSGSSSTRGGFQIWPEGMPDPTLQQLREAAELPTVVSEELPVKEETPVPVGATTQRESA